MADISQITIPINGVNTTFNFKDTVARNPNMISDSNGSYVEAINNYIGAVSASDAYIETAESIYLNAINGNIDLVATNGGIICENGQIEDSNGNTITLPSGGSAGQVLSKNSASSYDVGWVAPSGTLAPISRTIATAWSSIPSSTSAYSAVNTTGWNYEIYADGTVHAWGVMDISNVSMQTFANLRRSTSSYYMPYPVELSETTYLNFGPYGRMTQFGSTAVADMADVHNDSTHTEYNTKCAQFRPVQFGYYSSAASGQNFHLFVELRGKIKED